MTERKTKRTNARNRKPSKSERTRLEERNALRQFDWAIYQVEVALKNPPFALEVDLICTLNRLAVQGLELDAGEFRVYSVCIENSPHNPPGHEKVPHYMEELCEYVNINTAATPIHLAAYLLWRINWIHPFGEGNGRTARMISYMILCIRLGFILPGALTIPDQIANDRSSYYEVLGFADKAYENGSAIDVHATEELLEKLLATQLLEIHNKAKGN